MSNALGCIGITILCARSTNRSKRQPATLPAVSITTWVVPGRGWALMVRSAAKSQVWMAGTVSGRTRSQLRAEPCTSVSPNITA